MGNILRAGLRPTHRCCDAVEDGTQFEYSSLFHRGFRLGKRVLSSVSVREKSAVKRGSTPVWIADRPTRGGHSGKLAAVVGTFRR